MWVGEEVRSSEMKKISGARRKVEQGTTALGQNPEFRY
jgi:hypothetical protein